MAHMMLINPARRPKKRRATVKAKRKTTRRVRRNNPAPALSFSPVRRRRARRAANPIGHRRHHARRRRNPIGLGSPSVKGLMGMFKEAAIGGAGALGMDVLWGQVNPHLPASLQTTTNTVGIGDAVKALATALIGNALKRHTKGVSAKLAQASLTVQARDILSTMVPSSLPLGFFSPGRVINATARVGPNQAITRNVSPLLNKYTRPGVTPLLNAAQPAQPAAWGRRTSSDVAIREGVRYR